MLADPAGYLADAATATFIDDRAWARDATPVAEVTVARPLAPEQEARLRAALTRITGREVDIQTSIDPSVIGGVRVRLGDEIIAGTVADRLEQLHRQLS